MPPAWSAEPFQEHIQPLLQAHCAHCHGPDEANAEINFSTLRTTADLAQRPQLIEDLIKVLDSNEMPPEGEPPLKAGTRSHLIGALKKQLRAATSGIATAPVPMRRLNRFQYNNAVRDLFEIDLDIFALPEKLMTRHSRYLQSGITQMPKRVDVSCDASRPRAGLREVQPFPKDLRAAHGFDNQANQLSLSPLLLDAFLRLSVSILESPDFNESHVGRWERFFRAPENTDNLRQQVQERLEPFLRQAFRQPVDADTLQRYTAYTMSKINAGVSFTDSMKKVASAVLSSPLFLYRSRAADGTQTQFELASNLSFLLWASAPDAALLDQAERGELQTREQLTQTIKRMMADPKIERFLDTFPAQWMQLENLLAATPDPQQHRFYSLDKQHPASLQMILEPLLLFDALFIEDRPVVELIAPSFTYQSQFLETWYTSQLKPPPVDAQKVTTENQRKDAQRRALQTTLDTTKQQLAALLEPIRKQILAKREQDQEEAPPVDLKPYAAWEFDGDLKDSLQGLHLEAHGPVKFADGKAFLQNAYLLSKKLPIDLKEKTLEVWCQVHDLNQSGGGLMGIQGPGDFFDTIVLGERQARHWISGSNGFSRTDDFPESTPEMKPMEMLHLVMVYQGDGSTLLYRNGAPYGKPFRKNRATFPKNQTSVIFGLRHLPAGGNRYLTVTLDKARLYTRALTADEVTAAHSGRHDYISESELVKALTPAQRQQREELTNRLNETTETLKRVPPNQDIGQLRKTAAQRYDEEVRRQLRGRVFERVAATDPRYGGVITNAAMLSMTSGPKRTHPIARGAWIIEVIFNDPPPPPPNDVPPLNEEQTSADLTIREKFAQHRENPDCAGCHSQLDPLGFAMENFDITGRWRDRYKNGKEVDASGRLFKKYDFDGIVRFKNSLVQEERRFAKAFTAHLLRFALSRELRPGDSLTVDAIVERAESDRYSLQSLLREVILSDRFLVRK